MSLELIRVTLWGYNRGLSFQKIRVKKATVHGDVEVVVDMGGEDVVPHVANILKNDSNELVRHEAAFSLGQMCLRSGIKPLEDATRNDPSLFVRHEAAVALGVIGSQDEKETLQKALEDSSEQVRDSAVVALSNLKFMESLSKNEKFAKMTGG